MYDSNACETNLTCSAMSMPAITVDQADSLGTALCLMYRHNIGRLPVVDEAEKLCGMITYGDIRRLKILRSLRPNTAPNDNLQPVSVHDVMTSRPIAVLPETSLYDAGKLMVEHNISALPVVDREGTVVGIVTERDLFDTLVRRQTPERFVPDTNTIEAVVAK